MSPSRLLFAGFAIAAAVSIFATSAVAQTPKGGARFSLTPTSTVIGTIGDLRCAEPTDIPERGKSTPPPSVMLAPFRYGLPAYSDTAASSRADLYFPIFLPGTTPLNITGLAQIFEPLQTSEGRFGVMTIDTMVFFLYPRQASATTSYDVVAFAGEFDTTYTLTKGLKRNVDDLLGNPLSTLTLSKDTLNAHRQGTSVFPFIVAFDPPARISPGKRFMVGFVLANGSVAGDTLEMIGVLESNTAVTPGGGFLTEAAGSTTFWTAYPFLVFGTTQARMNHKMSIFGTFDSVDAALRITSPKLSDVWQKATSHAITWTSASTYNYVVIEYSTDGGTSWRPVASGNTTNNTYNWTIPNTPSTTCVVRISSSNGVLGTSDAFEIQGNVGVADAGISALSCELAENYPNPFNPSTVIRFSVPDARSTVLEVLDVYGRVVGTLANGRVGAGEHSITFDAANLPTGTYFSRLTAGSFSAVRRMSLVK